jgi:PAS domain S-box-containing protein
VRHVPHASDGGIDIDITGRKLAEAALRDSEQRFRRVFEQSPLGKAMAGLDFRFRAVNPALCAMLGYTEDELIGRGFLDIVHPDDRETCAALGRSLIDGSVPQIQIEERFLRKSGDALWVSVNVGPIRDADGNILYTLGIIENIDERKRFAQTLLDSETRLRLLNERLEQQAEERAAQLRRERCLQNLPCGCLVEVLQEPALQERRFRQRNARSHRVRGLPRPWGRACGGGRG